MSDPPSYSKGNHQKPPPYRASHAFASSAEELAALKQFAESKKYINPATDGTLPDIANGFGVKAMAWGGMSDRREEEMREMRETRRREKDEKLVRKGSLQDEKLVRKMSRQEEKEKEKQEDLVRKMSRQEAMGRSAAKVEGWESGGLRERLKKVLRRDGNGERDVVR
jgi:microsomal dipeptidase-like Zn-dependent dipeptidase